jgi:hypothetical protein
MVPKNIVICAVIECDEVGPQVTSLEVGKCTFDHSEPAHPPNLNAGKKVAERNNEHPLNFLFQHGRCTPNRVRPLFSAETCVVSQGDKGCHGVVSSLLERVVQLLYVLPCHFLHCLLQG